MVPRGLAFIERTSGCYSILFLSVTGPNTTTYLSSPGALFHSNSHICVLISDLHGVERQAYVGGGICSGPVFTKILILRIVLFLEFFLEFCSFLRIILRIRIFKIWNVLKSSLFGPI